MFFCDTILQFFFLGVFLQNDVEYAIFIRVWYDENTHAIFKSDGVRINTMKPATTKIRGSAVSKLIRMKMEML